MAYSFDGIRQAMLSQRWSSQNMTMNSSSTNMTDAGYVPRTAVAQVVQIVQECVKLNSLAQQNGRGNLPSNLSTMFQWCHHSFQSWFAGYYYEQWLNSTEYRTFITVHSLLYPSLIALSIMGTVMALCVLWRIVARQKRSAWYFLFAINNCILLKVLLDPLPRYAAKRFDSKDIYHTLLGCKLLTFLSNLFQYAPTWILTVALIDQITALRMTRNPSRSSSGSGQASRSPTLSYFAAKATVISILVGLGVINVHTLWLFNPKYINSGTGNEGGGGRTGSASVPGAPVNYTRYNYSMPYLKDSTNDEMSPNTETTLAAKIRCQMAPSDDPSPGIFTYGYPIFLMTMHAVVPQMSLLVIFVTHIIGCCCTGHSTAGSGSESNELRVISVCAVLHLLCDIPATVCWFYLQVGRKPTERTYQMFKTFYTINFTIKVWIFVKYTLFVPILFFTSPTFRRQVWSLIRIAVRSGICRGASSCRHHIALNCACAGKHLQCVCECTWPRCRQQNVQLCSHQCLCVRCRWPSLNSFDYTRGYVTESKTPITNAPTSAHASIEDPPDKQEQVMKRTASITTHLALPMFCDCACFQTEEKCDSTSTDMANEEKVPATKRRIQQQDKTWDDMGATEMFTVKSKPDNNPRDEGLSIVYVSESF